MPLNALRCFIMTYMVNVFSFFCPGPKNQRLNVVLIVSFRNNYLFFEITVLQTSSSFHKKIIFLSNEQLYRFVTDRQTCIDNFKMTSLYFWTHYCV